MVKNGRGRIYSQISSFLHACVKGRSRAALGDTPVCVCENTDMCVRGNTRMYVQGTHMCVVGENTHVYVRRNAVDICATKALE